MQTVRYVLEKDLRYIYATDELRNEGRFYIPIISEEIYVDIIQKNDKAVQLKLFFPNGEIKIGWVIDLHIFPCIRLNNPDLIFDGRFNS